MPAPPYTLTEAIVEQCRSQFPGLARCHQGQPAVFLDGPAGTQVPQSVIDAVADYLAHRNANHGGLFATSQESDEQLDQAHQAAADFLGTDDPDCVSFGPNMTTLTFALSRALSRTWQPGDEILLSHSEHDANFTPWTLAARDADVTVRCIEMHCEDTTLDLDSLRSQLSNRTRLVAVGCASNATGTVHPVREVCRLAREAGAVSVLDAVHFAPHSRVNVADFGCDFLLCSAYKFFGPHVGLMVGRRALLESLEAYKLRPAPDGLPGKWMTGTQNHEGIAGTLAAIDYLTELGRQCAADSSLTRPVALDVAFAAVRDYESRLVWQLIDGLSTIEGIKIWGITDPQRRDERLPTISLTSDRHSPAAMAQALGAAGVFVWHGDYYAVPLMTRLGVAADGMVRIGLAHYNTPAEIDRCLDQIRRLQRL